MLTSGRPRNSVTVTTRFDPSLQTSPSTCGAFSSSSSSASASSSAPSTASSASCASVAVATGAGAEAGAVPESATTHRGGMPDERTPSIVYNVALMVLLLVFSSEASSFAVRGTRRAKRTRDSNVFDDSSRGRLRVEGGGSATSDSSPCFSTHVLMNSANAALCLVTTSSPNSTAREARRARGVITPRSSSLRPARIWASLLVSDSSSSPVAEVISETLV
mmetsp:Transcript_14770/g.48410  ORF Transcript_14770/g.48410 Transcript_14770/m.48410 type:complete len:220 (+) Transcript_14770:207-866(+)